MDIGIGHLAQHPKHKELVHSGPSRATQASSAVCTQLCSSAALCTAVSGSFTRRATAGANQLPACAVGHIDSHWGERFLRQPDCIHSPGCVRVQTAAAMGFCGSLTVFSLLGRSRRQRALPAHLS